MIPFPLIQIKNMKVDTITLNSWMFDEDIKNWLTPYIQILMYMYVYINFRIKKPSYVPLRHKYIIYKLLQ